MELSPGLSSVCTLANKFKDITAANVLQHISGLEGLKEDEVLQIIGPPRRNPVIRHDSTEDGDESTAPQYLVYPVLWSSVDLQHITDKPCLIDFGESFEAAQPPEELGTPGPYRSPELILDNKAGFGSDIWALACTLFEIRTGRKLFSPFDDDDTSYLEAMTQVLGKLPEPWWSITWTDRRRLYKDEVDEHGRVVDVAEPQAVEKADDEGAPRRTVKVHPSVAEGARSMIDKLAPGVWYLSDERPNGDRHRDMPRHEMDLFADLLGKMLEYEPEKRLAASAALAHEWFNL